MSFRVLRVSALLIGCALLCASQVRAESEREGGDGQNKDGKDGKKGDKRRERPDGQKPPPPPPPPPQIFKAIMEHADELKITEDQKKQLHALHEEMQEVMEDPEIKELQKQIGELHKKMKELIAKKGGMTDESLMDSIKKILTEEQVAKLKSMRPPEGPRGPKPERKERPEGKRGDPAKGPPPLYDHEKDKENKDK
jgi:Spy/CpxP family protein refolding chaperone